MSDSLWPHDLQHTRLPCPSPSPGVNSHVCWVSDAIQPSHPLLPPSLLRLLTFPRTRVFSGELALQKRRWPKELQLQHQSFQWIFRIDFLSDWLVWSPCSPRDSQRVFFSTIQKHQFFSDQASLWSNSHICTWLLEKSQLWLYRPLSAKWCLCFWICCPGLS